jgi:hypothetical protein
VMALAGQTAGMRATNFRSTCGGIIQPVSAKSCIRAVRYVDIHGAAAILSGPEHE